MRTYFSFESHYATLIEEAHSNAHETLMGQQIERSKLLAAILQNSWQTSKNLDTTLFKSLKRVEFHPGNTLKTQSIHKAVRDFFPLHLRHYAEENHYSQTISLSGSEKCSTYVQGLQSEWVKCKQRIINND